MSRPCRNIRSKILSSLLIAAAFTAPMIESVQACTRVVYLGSNNTVITGRNLDWGDDMKTNLWVMPRGMQRDGAAGPNSYKWTSKYGSVISSAYDIATADGMNEKGVVANVLYLAESNYGSPNGKPAISISLWAQYVLDNFATVNEAVTSLQAEPFKIVPFILPDGRAASVHLSISDASGDSAIFEYIGGQLVIHHDRKYQVLTNSPTFDAQLAINAYWQGMGFQTFLPGTINPPDRFARAYAFVKEVPTQVDKNYINSVPNADFNNQALASTRGIMRSVAVPLGVNSPTRAEVSSTIWTTISDQKNKVYYFDAQTLPNTFWVELKDMDFSVGAPVKKLTVAGGRVYAGNTAKQFESAQVFNFFSAAPTSNK